MIECQGVTFYDPMIKEELQALKAMHAFGVKLEGLGRRYIEYSIRDGKNYPLTLWKYASDFKKYIKRKEYDMLWRVANEPTT